MKREPPDQPPEAWTSLFLLDPPPPLRAVCGRGGLVIAGGTELYMQRPGAELLTMRKLPDGEELVAVAAEARPPWRYAIATRERVTLFFKNEEGDAIVRVSAREKGAAPTHLAWANHGGASVLFTRWSDGTVTRTKRDMSGVEPLDVDVDACASDAFGRLALVSIGVGACHIYRTDHFGELVMDEVELDAHTRLPGDVRLAVAGDAVALEAANLGVLVTRARGAPLSWCHALPPRGPLAFEGPASDAALYGAAASGSTLAIVRLAANGAATLVAEIEGEEQIEMAELSWDVSRRVLRGASPQVGLVMFVPPSRGGGRRRLS